MEKGAGVEWGVGMEKGGGNGKREREWEILLIGNFCGIFFGGVWNLAGDAV